MNNVENEDFFIKQFQNFAGDYYTLLDGQIF